MPNADCWCLVDKLIKECNIVEKHVYLCYCSDISSPAELFCQLLLISIVQCRLTIDDNYQMFNIYYRR